MKRKLLSLPLAIIVFFFFLSLFSLAQEQARLVGDWQMVVEAEGQYYYLQLSLKKLRASSRALCLKPVVSFPICL